MRKRVVLTRPEERQRQLAAYLQQRGFDVLQLPALGIECLPADRFVLHEFGRGSSEVALEDASSATSVEAPVSAWSPSSFDVVVFVSRAAWQAYYQALVKVTSGSAFVWPSHTKVACVGLSTAHTIAADLQCSLSDVLFPDDKHSSDSEGLWLKLRSLVTAGERVLVVRGTVGRDWLADTMVAAGLSVSCLSVYRRVVVPWSSAAVGTLGIWAAEGHTGTWLVTSREGLQAMAAQLRVLDFMAPSSSQPKAVVVIHERLLPMAQQWLTEMWGSDPAAGKWVVPVLVARPDDESIAQTIETAIS